MRTVVLFKIRQKIGQILELNKKKSIDDRLNFFTCYTKYGRFSSCGTKQAKEVRSMFDLQTTIVAPIIVGIVLALFKHWLDHRKR